MARPFLLAPILTAGIVAAGVAGPVAALPPAPGRHQHQHAPPSEAPSPALEAQLEALRAATERFRDHAVAVAEGYELVGGDGPLMGEHWVRHDLTDRPFDPARPSTLQYLPIGGERRLTGVAYTVYRAPADPLPEGFAGAADVWHVHDLMKIAMTATEDRPLLRWLTTRRLDNGRTSWDRDRPELTMVHAWAWLDNPDGLFAQDHRAIPYVRAGLPAEWADAVSAGLTSSAAHGVALLAEGACALEVQRTNLLAAATWWQRRNLARACDESAGRVTSAFQSLDRGAEDAPVRLNRIAADAWRAYERDRDRILSPEQRARLAVMIEHPGGSR